jgi:hypothetical protein
MFTQKTSDLEQMLCKTHPSDMEAYLKSNREDLMQDRQTFTQFMREKLRKKQLKKQDVLLRADISLRYGYKLLTKEKVTRQRDVILRICYAAEFTLSETQQALRLYRMNTLYARDPRDAFLMVCFNTRPGNVLELNELLTKNKLEPLRSSGVQE